MEGRLTRGWQARAAETPLELQHRTEPMDERVEQESGSGLDDGALGGGIGNATLKRMQDDLFGLVHSTTQSEIKGAYTRLLSGGNAPPSELDEGPSAATISATILAALGHK